MDFQKRSLLLLPPLLIGALAALAISFSGLQADLARIGGLSQITDREAPRISIQAPEGVVRGTVTVTVTVDDTSGANLALLTLDDQPLPLESEVVIDTTALPDGTHTLIAEAEDLSLRGNRTTVVASFQTHNAAPVLDVQVDPPVIGIGQVGTLRVTADEPFTLTATLGGKSLPLFRDNDVYRGLLAFGVDEQPGQAQLQLLATDELGNQGEQTVPIDVAPMPYPVENVDLPDDVLPLLAPDLVEQEAARMDEIFSGVTTEKLWSGPFITPTVGWISSEFGERRSYNNGPLGSAHGGLDLATNAGMPVLADNAGRVVLAEKLGVRGNTIVVDHGWGVFTAYFHLSQFAVQEGQMVAQGDLLGRVGSTGLSTGPHLHWEMHANGPAVQPREWVEREIGN